MMPMRFETQMNMNSVKISGKNFMPSAPALPRIVAAMNS